VKALTTIIYKPIGLIFGILSGIIANKIFNFIWSKIDEEEPPDANTEEIVWPKLIAAVALQGVVWRVTRTLADRWIAKSFAYLTGIWPGERRPERA